MKEVCFCPKCGTNLAFADGEDRVCPRCRCRAVGTGCDTDSWYAQPLKEREKKKQAILAEAGSVMPDPVETPAERSKNSVAAWIKTFAIIIYIGAVVTGLLIGIDDDWLIALAVIGGGFFTGTMILGYSEIIRLLHQINENTSKIE